MPLLPPRSQLVRLASECLATAANPAKGGFVREALINSYPKLAALMEDTLHKIRRDTEVLISHPGGAAGPLAVPAILVLWFAAWQSHI